MEKQTRILISLGVLLLLLFIGSFFFNAWMEKQMKAHENFNVTQTTKSVKKISDNIDKYRRKKGKIARMEMADPSRKFSQSIIYDGDEEIAKLKSNGDNIYEVEGKIPDGKVSFKNVTAKTYGSEYFRSNKRHGKYIEYFDGGRQKRQATFKNGKMITNKTFYINSVVRMQEDYSDPLIPSEDKEVGEGKVFYRDGTLMYEWSLTRSGRGGYKRSYNKNGKLVDEKLFNQYGERIEK